MVESLPLALDVDETLPPPIPTEEYVNTPQMQSLLAHTEASAAPDDKNVPQKEGEKNAQVG